MSSNFEDPEQDREVPAAKLESLTLSEPIILVSAHPWL